MKRVLALAGCLWLACATVMPSAAAPLSAQAPGNDSAPYRAIVDQYCVTCHNARLKTGDLVLEKLEMSNVAADAAIWEKVVRKVRAGVMPPQGARQPDDPTKHGLVAWLEGQLDRAAASHPNPGRPLLHRLNRAEYQNA